MIPYQWTSKKPINGLRHFVLVDQFEKKGRLFVFLVSVLDSEISCKISFDELKNSEEWEFGWKDLHKDDSITSEYIKFKKKKIGHCFLKESSIFNIS